MTDPAQPAGLMARARSRRGRVRAWVGARRIASPRNDLNSLRTEVADLRDDLERLRSDVEAELALIRAELAAPRTNSTQ